jgi:Flp pilus assembly protein TadB
MNLASIEIVYNLVPIVLCIVVALLAVSTQRLRQQTNNQHRKINQLNEELNALLSCSRGISKRLHSHQNQFQNIAKRQDNLETVEPGHAGYKQAIALYNRGASEDEMQSTCDLSRGEINLITHLEKARTRNHSQHQH